LQLSKYETKDFEDLCTKRVATYFRKFDCWTGSFQPQIIENARTKEKELFQILDNDWMLEIVDEENLIFVGLKPYFYPQRNSIIKALQEVEAERLEFLDLKEALNPNFLNLTINREKFWP